MTATAHVRRPPTGPALPGPRGPLSRAVLAALARPGGRADGTERGTLPPLADVRAADPYGADLQLALYALYELHYRGFTGVPDAREWDPELLRVRGALESRFLEALRADTPPSADVDQVFADLLTEPADHSGSVAYHLEHSGERWQMREYAALRSLYHLKEADPHAWVIPRLHGRPKAGMVAIEYDEFGAGRADEVHSQLFADLLSDLHLDTAYGRYLEVAGAETLATVNVMTLFGLHRELRGALVGHFACVEVTSSPASRRLTAAMRRLNAGAAAERYYAEHVEADAVHEQVVRREVVDGLLAQEPQLAADVVLGVTATEFLEDRLSRHLLTAWRAGHTALRQPL
ncbi:iron-containing redox enzyme family protein [Actinacidiphila acidipaludis]|uniref:Iron-containing redox enzyme family protein n=1 Tax=Actinacidiphila acidipaludis TaxID=2873382 RepID=A0ABS7QIQ8_9ACTN|nr:iron-containing redox enzyme family protein [Streptomyces acidipaludis]MBY8883055.1 iron-containing redox enzyme family protein [Streptomyces acidipaludis]